MHQLYLIILLSSSLLLQAQSPKPGFSEYKWSFFHPIAAMRVRKITETCNKMANSRTVKLALDSFSNGGKIDAFRHIYYMASYSQVVKGYKIKKLGIEHEKSNYRQFRNLETENDELPDSLSSVMDLRNNELGIKLGLANRNLNPNELQSLVIEEIKKGNALIMLRKKNGNYLNCKGEVIDLKQYKQRWSIPKCLVRSDLIYED